MVAWLSSWQTLLTWAGFALAFALGWCFLGWIVGLDTGWYRLARRYPDRDEPALLDLQRQYGRMGGLRLGGVLRFGVCDSGLRIGLHWSVGPFCKTMLVPWSSLSVVRKRGRWGRSAELSFDYGKRTVLAIPEHLANRLGRAAASRWPEDYLFSAEMPEKIIARAFKRWFGSTAVMASALIILPRMLSPLDEYITWYWAITLAALLAARACYLEVRQHL